jgi:hypothetical protein
MSAPRHAITGGKIGRENRARDSTAERRWISRTFEANEADGVLGAALSDPLEELGKGGV